MEMKPVDKEKALSHKKARGVFKETCEELLERFMNMYEHEDVDAVEIPFDDVEYLGKIYDSCRNVIKKEKMPIEVTISKKRKKLWFSYKGKG